MKRESKMLLQKACDSLLLAIELFNRPHDRGRISGTLIFLDHAFEMFMKAAILHKGGRIRDKRAKETIGFDACVRRSLSDGRLKYLTEEQALTIQTINGLRDAAQHHLLDISEAQLYIHIQSGVTLFRELLKEVFGKELNSYLPERVLPVSTSAPLNLMTLFDNEVDEVRKLLQPGRRRRVEALSRLRPLAILDATIRGEKRQPSDGDLRRISKRLENEEWQTVFPGVAAIEIVADPNLPSISLRLSKKDGVPIRLVPEGTPGATVVAVKRVNELDYYNLSATQLAGHLDLTVPKLIAIVECIGLRSDSDCYREFRIGSALHKRYSQKAISRIRESLEEKTVDEYWHEYSSRRPKGSRHVQNW